MAFLTRRLFTRLLLLLLLCATLATSQSVPESQVKAAYVLNFTKFVEWPDTAFRDEQAPFGICILGHSPIAPDLERLVRGENVNGRPIILAHIQRPPEARSCQVVIANASDKNAAKALANTAPGVLTIGEGESFAREGGMIGFVLDNRRVRFDINQRAASRSSLILSARLLSVARMVYK